MFPSASRAKLTRTVAATATAVVHALCEHATLHVVPHAPQWRGSVVRSTQLVPHAVWPAVGQVHVPDTQLAPGGHALPHMPQCVVLVARTAQVPEQSTPPLGQRQLPSTHEAPVGQRFPQAPQFVVSLAVSAHVPAPVGVVGGHAVLPLGHWQAPPTHAIPDAQRLPQLPQCDVFVDVSRQAPEQTVSEGFVQAQAPSEQISPVALHCVSQSPHRLRSFSGS